MTDPNSIETIIEAINGISDQLATISYLLIIIAIFVLIGCGNRRKGC